MFKNADVLCLEPLSFDTCSFARKATQVVQFRAANFAVAINFHFLNVRRIDREDTLYADTV